MTMFSSILLVLGVAVLGMAFRSFHHPVMQRLGIICLLASSFLIGYLASGSWLIGLAVASIWIFLPWLEILTRIRTLRMPVERELPAFRRNDQRSFSVQYGRDREVIHDQRRGHVLRSNRCLGADRADRRQAHCASRGRAASRRRSGSRARTDGRVGSLCPARRARRAAGTIRRHAVGD